MKMSSFHPLERSRGGAAAAPANNNHHPLAPVDLPFHTDGDEDDDNDTWSPPSLPGAPHILDRTNTSHSTLHRSSGGGGGGGLSPLETPLDPLLNTLPSPTSNTYGAVGGAYSAHEPQRRKQQQQAEASSFSSPSGVGEARGISQSGGYGGRVWTQGTWSGGRAGNSDGGSGEESTAADLAGPVGSERVVLPGRGGRSVAAAVRRGVGGQPYSDGSRTTLAAVHTLQIHSYYAPTFCDACSQLLVGIMQQGLQCDVCRMNLHPECRSTPCSDEHRCRPPEPVRLSDGIADASQVRGVRLKPGYPSPAAGGAAAGVLRGRLGAAADPVGVEDPLQSEWHKLMMKDKQLWVPDAVAAGCMVCSRAFNLVIRRHHCRRCGACMCSWCSHMAVSDKILAVQQKTGAVMRISTSDPVRCCTPCTRILDKQLTEVLQRRAWAARKGTPVAQTMAPSVAAVASREMGHHPNSSRAAAASSAQDRLLFGGGRGGRGEGGSAAEGGEYGQHGGVSSARSGNNRNGDGVTNFSRGGGGGGGGGGGDYNGSRKLDDSHGTGTRGGVGRDAVAVLGSNGSRTDNNDDPLAGEFVSPTRTYQNEQRQQEDPSPTAAAAAIPSVPSWLGKSMLGPSPTVTPTSFVYGSPSVSTTAAVSNANGGEYAAAFSAQGMASTCAAAGGDGEDDDEGGGVFDPPTAGEEVEAATDWSTSGAVV